jgi:5-histidylcysteine sulfoxide synthase/putative 4-mercaptohistidine N1-methyltranferase
MREVRRVYAAPVVRLMPATGWKTMNKPLFPRSPKLADRPPEAVRRDLIEAFHATQDRYEQLFETLACEAAWYEKPISLRHPLIFYFGHTATFFVNKLLLAGLIEARLNPRLESIFAVGVDEMSWDDLDDTRYEWPPIEAVRDYRRQVRHLVDGILRHAPLILPIDWQHPWWAILMGIDHERIHLETSSVLIRQHRLDYVRPHADWAPCREAGLPPPNDLVDIPAGTVSLGKAFTDAWYGWDNEYGRHPATVGAFQASRQLVSNHEFLAFVEAGGYEDDRWWNDEGLAWRNFARATAPTFWLAKPAGWQLRLMTEEVPMPWNWPVETNYHEAKAFCLWKTAQSGQPVRLPSEDEWHRLAGFAGIGEVEPEQPSAANLHLDHWASSCPVDRFAHGLLFDVVGNVWQWTETPIYPFDGFAVHPIYDDFTTPTFDGRHNLIKGGSWISSGDEARLAARYAFRRHFFQHAGFRYVVAETPAPHAASHYETDELMGQYAEFHFGDSYYGVPNFPATLAALAVEAMGGHPKHRALDLGCATGRACFELARHFDEVTGIDFSARFIGLGVQMAEQGRIRYTLPEEGELVGYRERTLAELGLAETAGRVSFWQGDACNLKPNFTGYDLILAANLIDRLHSPSQFLASVHERLNPGGLLLIASPYTWLAEHTRREHWLGGFKKDGENFTTLDGLHALLDRHFEAVGMPRDVPFVIRETKRKFQHTLSEVTLWRRR